MKAITTALMDHIHQDVTTLASCWLITRTDGQVFAFTDHDAPLVVNGATYEASSGYLRSALKTDQTLAVDNMDVTGILNSSAISDADLKAGRFDYAQIQLFMVNWADLSQGILKMRSGTFGESVWTPTGTFQAELRGLTQSLVTDVTKSYTPTCRADLGDAQCGIPIAPGPWAPGVTVDVGTYVSDPAAPASGDDARILAVYQCTSPGTTGPQAPYFNSPVGTSTIETSGVVWTSMTPIRVVGTVQTTYGNSKNSFVSTPVAEQLTSFGTSATVAFTAASVEGMQIVLSVGTQTVTFTLPTPNDSRTGQVKWLTNAINEANAQGQIAATANMVFTVTGTDAVNITKINQSDSGSVTVNDDTVNEVQIVNFAGAGDAGNPYWVGGLLTWVTGLNAGLSMEIKDFDTTMWVADLFLSMPFKITAGDKFYMHPGCDKARGTCLAQFNNILNFRGEPDVPGMDIMMTYPDAAQS